MHFSKARCCCDIDFPQHIFAVNEMKGFDYIWLYYYKWISSNGKVISESNLKWGRWSKTPNVGCFFMWVIECVEKTGFVQLITSLPNEAENLPWYNYRDKGQSWISLANCYLKSFLVTFICLHEERLGVLNME